MADRLASLAWCWLPLRRHDHHAASTARAEGRPPGARWSEPGGLPSPVKRLIRASENQVAASCGWCLLECASYLSMPATVTASRHYSTARAWATSIADRVRQTAGKDRTKPSPRASRLRGMESTFAM